MTTITQKLDQLAEYQAQFDYLLLKKQEIINTVITPEIQARLEEIDAEFNQQFVSINEKADALESEIKAEVIQAGATIKAAHLQAVFTKGRITWDTKALDGYAAAHPEIAPFRKEGAPSVSIRKV